MALENLTQDCSATKTQSLADNISNNAQDYRTDALKLANYFASRFKRFSWIINSNEELIGLLIEALVIADRKWDKNGGASKRTYRYKNAKFCILNYIKKQSGFYKKNEPLYEEVHYTVKEESFSPEDMEQVRKMLNICPLSKNERIFIEKYYFESYTLKEIGEEFGCSLQNVQQTIGRGLQLLRESFNWPG